MIQHPVLAIDYGMARVGLANTDMLGIAVHPAGTLDARTAVSEIIQLIDQKQIKQLVVGIPLLKDGSEGDSAEKARAFSNAIVKERDFLDVHFEDESFSTVDAATKLHAVGLNAKKQKGVIDQAAAMEILNRWLEKNGEGMDLPFPPL